MERVPMTADGYARLGAELKRLKTEERPSIIKAISAARENLLDNVNPRLSIDQMMLDIPQLEITR